MITIKLADGSERQLEEGKNVFDLAKSISNGLARRCSWFGQRQNCGLKPPPSIW